MIRLICLDLDGTLVASNNFWMELHKRYNTEKEGMELTKKYLRSDYQRLVREVPGRLWLGKDAAIYHHLADSIQYNTGIREFFDTLDRSFPSVPRAIVTGGCYDIADRVKKEFNIEFIFANQLGTKDGKVSGDFHWPVGAGFDVKAKIIQALCDDLDIGLHEVLMIGDSESDLAAFQIVGTSIAFNDSPDSLRAAATYIVEGNDLRRCIPVLEQIHNVNDR